MLDIAGCIFVWCGRAVPVALVGSTFMSFFHLIPYRDVEPVVTHQASWLDSTGVHMIHQSRAWSA